MGRGDRHSECSPMRGHLNLVRLYYELVAVLVAKQFLLVGFAIGHFSLHCAPSASLYIYNLPFQCQFPSILVIFYRHKSGALTQPSNWMNDHPTIEKI